MAKSTQIEVRQVRSQSGRPEKHRKTLHALGLHRNQASVIHTDSPAIRGMIKQVEHLVEVREFGS